MQHHDITRLGEYGQAHIHYKTGGITIYRMEYMDFESVFENIHGHSLWYLLLHEWIPCILMHEWIPCMLEFPAGSNVQPYMQWNWDRTG